MGIRRSGLSLFGSTFALAVVFVCLSHAQTQSIHDRNTTAKAIITGSHGRYDGAFSTTATSSICGEIPKESSLTGTAVFVIEFPSDGTGEEPVRAIAFGSRELVGGVTETKRFGLNVHVTTPEGARPPAYVLNTDLDPPIPNNDGTAILTQNGAETILRVIGRNDMGETIDLTVTCR